MKTAAAFTVSGPGIDKHYPSAEVALSVAVSRAERCREEATFYVRAADGRTTARVEHDRRGTTQIRLSGVA